MIKGFENETAPLNEFELQVQKQIIRGLSVRIGYENSIKASEMIAGLNKIGIKINDIRLRKIINNIRVNGLINGLCATSHGYYIAGNNSELNDYIQSLDQRIKAQQAVLNQLVKFRNEQSVKQLELIR